VPLRRTRPSRAALRTLALAPLCALTLSACGDTLQDRPVAHNTLEGLLTAPYPVYWLGRTFQGMQITEASHDPGGAFMLRYGDCVEGGQGTCVPPVRVVTSPDNSFMPGGGAPRRTARIRGTTAVLAERGHTIELPAGGVVVGIYATSASLAAAAAATIVPINAVATPGGPLPAPLPDTGFATTPLPSQMPAPLHRLR
jgi:hypothetical protein